MPGKQIEDRETLCVLITNRALSNRAGTELYVRDVALELLRRGHTPVLYSPRLGSLAQDLREASIIAVDDLNKLDVLPDIIHGHHNLETMTAIAFFPDTPAIFFCHGLIPWEEMAPLHPRIQRYVAVSHAVQERLVHERGIAADRVTTISNFVDLDRFRPRSDLPAIPRRALLFSNQANEENFGGVVRTACARNGIALDIVGIANGNPTSQPETLLTGYDIVFARGRAAIEGLAVGVAVICCDLEGAGPLVTPDNVDWLRCFNFGLTILNRPISVETLSKQIQRYNREDARAASRIIRSKSGLTHAVDRIIEEYRKTLAGYSERNLPGIREDSQAYAVFLSWLSKSLDEYGPVSNRNARQLEKELHAIKNLATWKIRHRLMSIKLLRASYLWLSGLFKGLQGRLRSTKNGGNERARHD